MASNTRDDDRAVKLLRYRVYRGGELIGASALFADAVSQVDAYARNAEHKDIYVSVQDAHSWNSPTVYVREGGSIPSGELVLLKPPKTK